MRKRASTRPASIFDWGWMGGRGLDEKQNAAAARQRKGDRWSRRGGERCLPGQKKKRRFSDEQKKTRTSFCSTTPASLCQTAFFLFRVALSVFLPFPFRKNHVLEKGSQARSPAAGVAHGGGDGESECQGRRPTFFRQLKRRAFLSRPPSPPFPRSLPSTQASDADKKKAEGDAHFAKKEVS